MREIKFRAWDKKSGSCDYEICIGKANGSDSYITYLGIGETETIDVTIVIEQYTDLKDKNGVEIYEGDIVKWGKGLEKNERIAEVEISQCGVSFNSRRNGRFFYSNFIYKDTEKYLEVIGNIHENPELLKDK